MTERPAGSITSVRNALRIVEAIGPLQPVGVSRLAREVALPKSSVQRALRTLDEAGWIRAVGGEQTRWELTSTLLAISLAAFGEYSLRDFAEPAMAELRRRTGETVQLVARDGDGAVIVHRLDSDRPVRSFVPVGGRSPLHATASGHAILSFLPRALARQIIERNLRASTGPVVGDVDEILESVDAVRERGYAFNIGAWKPELASIGSAILGIDGTAVAAMTISIPISRFSEDDIETFGAWSHELARGLGRFASIRSEPAGSLSAKASRPDV